MLHLALVENLLTSIAAAPHLSRPNLPPPPGRYPPTGSLTLLPFGERGMRDARQRAAGSEQTGARRRASA
jgi:hypothetical protein